MRLIDADELITTLDEELQKDSCSISKVLLAGFAKQILNDAPTVDAEPIRHGRWEYDVKTAGFKCSECGKRIWSMTLEIAGINYCPNCGARMSDDDTAPSEEAYDDFYAKHRD